GSSGGGGAGVGGGGGRRIGGAGVLLVAGSALDGVVEAVGVRNCHHTNSTPARARAPKSNTVLSPRLSRCLRLRRHGASDPRSLGGVSSGSSSWRALAAPRPLGRDRALRRRRARVRGESVSAAGS